ncbi:MAG: BMP family ABC transporter substrate-binding protein [Oscillospiraceae bacterium]|jgi:basic membrane protein A|nr:BMP family ABC transporter substrate-binding protein [Oscillospiraceae bacterium]
MKKTLAIILAAALMLFSFAACAGETTPAPTADPTTAAENTAFPADFKIAIIHIQDPATGNGYSYAHDQGLVGAMEALDIPESNIIRKLNVSDGDKAATRTAIEEAIDQGAKLVFTTSFGYMETTAEIAEEYPDVIFSHCSGYKSNETNFNNYFGRIYQARYLSGIAAGLKTTTNKIGYVAAFGDTMAETSSGINSFALGVQAVNPDAEVYVKVLGAWGDEVNETAFADALYDMDCDVIAQHCDSANPQISAQNNGIFGCGYNSDMTPQAPAAHLTAPIWNWTVYYTAAIEAAVDGKWVEFGNYYAGVKEGFVDVSPLSANCAEGTQEKIDAVKAILNEGTWDVFSGVKLSFDESGNVVKTDAALEDSKGNVIVEAGGASVEDGVITGTMNYYVKGVSEK